MRMLALDRRRQAASGSMIFLQARASPADYRSARLWAADRNLEALATRLGVVFDVSGK
jgi:hypothetical protein